MTATTRVCQVAKLIGRYRPVYCAGVWRIVNMDTDAVMEARPADEIAARAGARLAAAADIVNLFEVKS